MSARQQQQRKKRPLKEVPYLVTDAINNRLYTRGNFLGKGGFARCYELVDNTSKTLYAGKVVSKLLLSHKHQKSKMVQEVEIHRHLSHAHIVRMYHCFEDVDNVYVLLELCARRSLMELHKRRRALTEPEARYFTHQLILGVTFLHEKKIIHRDLKLGNLFLNNDMQLKIGDFGLATTLDFDGERKMTLCGTPNYISPEMLDKKGHSFEVDIWAIGCILYILLVGNPPFETEELKDTYARIKMNQYVVPPRLGRDATNLIKRLLAADPARRPKITEILTTPFFTEGFLPAHLPTSCLTMAPKFNVNAVSGGVGDENLMFRSPAASRAASRLPVAVGCVASPTRGAGGMPTQSRVLATSRALNQAPAHTLATVPEANVPHQRQDAASVLVTEKAPGELNDYLTELFSQLSAVLNTSPQKFNDENLDDVQDPASSPIYWVSKWVDYSDRYGLGYQLCDNNIGVLFNDSTKIILNVAAEQIQYTERNNAEHYYTMQRYPPALEKKVTLLRYFCGYMNEHLLKAGQNIQKRDGDELGRLPCLQTWFRTKSAIVLHLSNGTLQINFFHDHSKVIVCPLMGAATFINSDKSVATYKFSLLEEFGCPKELHARLKYTKVMAERLLSRNKTSQPGSLSTVNLRPQSDGRGRIIN